ncbi:hypothetical protein MYP14_18820 [Rhodococcus pyridinivorans]|uniref:hypothetical protein n=1 Tax=Rhodococcus pyridinivorans TaxID=103816 RepID=UPI001FFFA437|nr:hypothetical protein [Rhodococcus pyridinivorans]UPK62793.1 hypothetical protein MYP14_18820 [Rhodococcus pyridinivorans]
MTTTLPAADTAPGERTEIASDAWHYGFVPARYERASIEWMRAYAAVSDAHAKYMRSIGYYRWASYQGRTSYYSSRPLPFSAGGQRSFVFLEDGTVVEVSSCGSQPYRRVSDGSVVGD